MTRAYYVNRLNRHRDQYLKINRSTVQVVCSFIVLNYALARFCCIFLSFCYCSFLSPEVDPTCEPNFNEMFFAVFSIRHLTLTLDVF